MITSFPKLLSAAVITLKLLSVSLIIGLFIGFIICNFKIKQKHHLLINLLMGILIYLEELHYWFKFL